MDCLDYGISSNITVFLVSDIRQSEDEVERIFLLFKFEFVLKVFLGNIHTFRYQTLYSYTIFIFQQFVFLNVILEISC